MELRIISHAMSSVSASIRRTCLVAVGCAGILLPAGLAEAQSVWTGTTTSGTSLWSNSSNWLGGSVPASGVTTSLQYFSNTTTPLSSGTITANNDNAGTFTLNRLVLRGLSPATTATTSVVINGGDLAFGGSSPALSLEGNSTTGVLNYTIANNIAFNANTTLGGNGSAGLTLAGVLSGNATLTKTGTSAIQLNGDSSSTFSGGLVIGGGGVTVNGGLGGKLASNQSIVFTGGGAFTFASNATSVSGTVGAVEFQAGSGSVNHSRGAAGSSQGLILSSVSVAQGATGRFDHTGGGSVGGNTAVRIANQAVGYLPASLSYSTSPAYYTTGSGTAGFVRDVVYGTTPNSTALSGTQTTLGANTGNHVQYTATSTGSQTLTGTNGATQVTVTTPGNFMVGGIVAGANVPAFTYVTAISGSTLTLSKAITGANPSVTSYTAVGAQTTDSIASLRFSGNGGSILLGASQTLTISSGGLYSAGNNSNSGQVIAGGSGITTGGATSLYYWSNSVNGGLSVQTPILATTTGGLVVTANTAALELAAANAFTGGIWLNSGNARVAFAETPGTSGPLGASGTISFRGGSLQYSSANTFDYSSRFSTDAGQLYSVNTNGQNVTWATSLTSVDSTLTKANAAGNLTLSASNAFTSVAVTNGLVRVGDANALGSGTVTLSGGGLATADATDRTIANPIGITADATFGAPGAGRLTLAGPVELPSTTLQITQAGTNGVLDISGPLTGSGTFSLNNGSHLTLSGNNAGWTPAAISLVSNAQLTLNSVNALGSGSAPIGINGNTLSINADMTGANSRANQFALAGSLTISGSQGLTVLGSLTASAADRTLTNNIQSDKLLTFAGPVLLRNGTDTTARTITFGGSGNTTISGTIANGGASGSASIVKSGTGILRLTAANTYTGTTGISAGILAIGGTGSLPGWNTAGRYGVAAGATLAVQSGVADASVLEILGTGNFAANAGIGFDTSDGNRTYGGTAIGNTSAGTLNLVKIGSGTLTMNTANTYTGTTAINEGMLQLGVGDAIVSSGLVAISGNGQLSFASTVTSATLTALSATTAIPLQNAAGQAVALSVGASNASFTYSSNFSGLGSLAKIGTGSLTLSGSNSYAGPTTVGGGILSLGNANALAGGNILFKGGTMQFGVSGTWANAVVGSTSAMAFDTGSQSVTISTPLASSNVAGLTKLGSGTLTLEGNNSYSGTTTVSAGVLRASGNSAFGTNSAVSLTNAAGVGLDLNGYSATIGSLSGGGTAGGSVNLSTGTLTVGTSNANSTYSGVFTGAGSVVKTGVGTLTLTPAVSSTMSLAVNRGLVSITPPAGRTVGTSTITRSAGGMVSFPVSTGTVATSTPLTNGIIGPWAVTGTTYATTAGGIVVPYTSGSLVAGSYSTSLIDTTGTMNYDVFMNTGSPASAFSANTIRFYSGSGSRTLTPGATLFAVNGLLNVDASSMTIGSGTIRSGVTRELVMAQGAGTGGGFTVNSVIADSLSGSSTLTLWAFANATTFALNGANTFTGDITMVGAAGSLVLGSGSFHATTTGNVFLSQGASLTVNNNGPQSMGNIVGVGSTLTKTGTGVLTLSSATSSFTGLVSINAGTLSVSTLGMAGSIGSLGTNGTINVGTSSTTGGLRYTGTGETTDRVINLSGTTGGATLEANGSGPLVLTSAITATGTGGKTFTLSATGTSLNQIGPIAVTGVSVNKTGPGLWRLTGDSSYDGPLSVLDGTVVAGGNVGSLNSTSPLGQKNPIVGGSTVTASGTAALLLEGGLSIVRQITVDTLATGASQVAVLGATGTGVATFGNGSTSIWLGRSVTLQASGSATARFWTQWLDGNGNPNPVVAYTIGSAGNAGVVQLERELASSATGVSVVNGTAQLIGSSVAIDRIDSATPVTVGSTLGAATLDLNGLSQSLSRLTFAGNSGSVTTGDVAGGMLRLVNSGSVSVSGTGHLISAAVALDDAASFNVASGGRLRISGAIATGSAGAHSLTKTGAGILELSGANTYAGTTTVSDGTLVVNGSLAGGTLSVAAAATLMGSGTIGGPATIAGIHSPGNSPGIETFSSNLTYSGSSSQVIWELWGNADDENAGSRGSLYDGINVDGSLDFAGATSLSLVFTGTGSSVDWDNAFWATDQTWTLFDVAGTTSNLGNFTLINSPASWLDANGLAFADSSRSANTFTISQSQTNSDVLLRYTVVVPEPTSFALAAIGIAAAAYATRRRSCP